MTLNFDGSPYTNNNKELKIGYHQTFCRSRVQQCILIMSTCVHSIHFINRRRVSFGLSVKLYRRKVTVDRLNVYTLRIASAENSRDENKSTRPVKLHNT